MPCGNTYLLTWVSLTLNVGYLFMAAPAKPPLLTLDEVAPPDLERRVAPLSPPASAQPPLLGCGVAPLALHP